MVSRTKWALAGLLACTGLLGLEDNRAAFDTGSLAVVSGFLQDETSTAAAAGTTPSLAEDGAFSSEQLEQLVAPIALYPDSLLLQILMASTYPLEIVEADRFMKKNSELKEDALEQALKSHDWDPSVKSLCTLPDVLKQMSENLDWTQDLGDAFLAQKDTVMDTVQKMRGLAFDEGNLETTEQQTVTQQEDKIIVIESNDPEVIYVPTYSSTVVYGPSWGYPSWYYPPFYYPPPAGYGFLSFTAGVIVGGAIWGSCGWGWGHTDIDIDVNRYNDFNRNTSIDSDRNRIDARQGRDGKSTWQHDSSHRKGVNYRSSDVAQQFGGSRGSSRVTRDQARGRSPSTGNRAANRGAASPSTRPSTGSLGSSRGTSRSSNNRSALSGSRSPSFDRAASSRGASSRGASSFGGSRGSRGTSRPARTRRR